MRCLVWFREDLRINDNAALHHAARAAKNGLIAVYIISPQEWRSHNVAACRVDFILRNLKELNKELTQLNIPLLIRHAATGKQVLNIIQQIIQEHKIDALFFNKQYEIDEDRRDLKVEKQLKQQKINVFSYTDQVIFSPGELLTGNGNYYTVFTPFKKSWFKHFNLAMCTAYSVPQKQAKLTINSDDIPDHIDGFKSNIDATLWPAGEKHAQRRLAYFIQEKIRAYDKQRDFPAIDGTSTLSPYLAAGILSPRQCLKAALEANKNQLETGNKGVATWINELIWREFYKHILVGFPRVSMGRAFKLETEKLPWDNDKKLFAAWQEGRTGFPIIDAAMQQLKQTGWMHNRLRMITAMFLVKDLLIDWRWGEKHFALHLIDGDLAANNGGWQWSASTGTDAAPYFRIFNPISQSQKFDPTGNFIRRYCPELSKVEDEAIHDPGVLGKSYLQAINYPVPIVDHSQARARFIKLYKALKT